MAHAYCPSCDKRLRTPDTDEPVVIRCPSCKHTFTTNSETPEGQQSPPRGLGPGTNGEQAVEPERELEEELERNLSASDEAMLRDFGSGTGLLELTRDTYRSGFATEDGAGLGAAPTAEDAQRQFQVVATALGLANRLVQTHKADATRTRRSARLAWGAVAGLVVLGGTALWYGTLQAGVADLARANAENELKREQDNAVSAGLQHQAIVDSLTATLTRMESQSVEEKARSRKFSDDLDKARAELSLLQGELATARESIGENKGAVQILTTELEASKAMVSELTGVLARAREPATQPAPEE